MDNTQKAYLQLHIAILLFGLTAILGDLINLSAIVLVWWRVLITSISLLFLIGFGKGIRKLPSRLIFQYMGIGVLIALHWIAFFGSVKYSNASICLVSFATTSLFTSFLEPLIFKTPVKWYEVALAIIVIPGMALVVNSLDFSMWFGFFLGVISAALASLFAIFNKMLVNETDSFTITFLELGSGWLFISLLLPFYFVTMENVPFLPNWEDLGYLLILSLVCTTFAYVIALRSLKHLSAYTANLTLSLEPVYGIILAILILHENKELNTGFYIGSGLILLTVLIHPVVKKVFEKSMI